MVGYRTVVPGRYKRTMEDKPHWTELCQQAAVEQDHEKLMELIDEINRLLEDKEQRLRPTPRKQG